jgi:ribosomal protein S12 methylthiotransferase
LIATIAACPKVARYVDIPLQHIHGVMLERMRRETSPQYIIDLLKRIRAGIPGIALRTTFIVGFPGETEGCFETLLDFIRQTRFERLGVFTYSPENGTLSQRMAAQIAPRVKEQRRALAMAAQLEIAREISRSYVGRRLKVLVEKAGAAKKISAVQLTSWEHGLLRSDPKQPSSKFKGSWSVARGEADAPDIDGRVYVNGALPEGEFAQVEVTGYADYDLVARPV